MCMCNSREGHTTNSKKIHDKAKKKKKSIKKIEKKNKTKEQQQMLDISNELEEE